MVVVVVEMKEELVVVKVLVKRKYEVERRRKVYIGIGIVKVMKKCFREGVFCKMERVRCLLAGHGDGREVGYFGEDIFGWRRYFW